MSLQTFPMWTRDVGNAIDCASSAVSELGCIFLFPDAPDQDPDIPGHRRRIESAKEGLVEAMTALDAALAAMQ